MEPISGKTPSAYEFPLLIKHILKAPIDYRRDQEIVYRDSKRFSYREFHERVARLATALTELGIKKGDTVAVMDWDSNRYLECYFAIPMIGAVMHMINMRLAPEQLIYTIDHAEDQLILVHRDFVPLIQSIKGRIAGVKRFVLMNDWEANRPPAQGIEFAGEYEELLAKAAPMEEYPDFDENTRATTFYTTGTTGLPKAVFYTHRQLVLHTMGATATLASIRSGPGFHGEDVYMPITPMFHVHAWGIPYVATFLGVKQVYPGKYVPDMLNSLIEKEKVTFSHCVPTILAMLLKDPSAKGMDWSKWKVVIGGAALPKALAAMALGMGIDIFAGYGMSETCPFVSIDRLTREDLSRSHEEQLEKRTRTGTAIGLMYLRVIDPKGNDVKRDNKSSGEIVLRAPWLTMGYYKDAKNSEKLWEGGWMHTQDVAVMNDDRSVRITDRLKDVVKVGGEWLSSLEMEDILASQGEIEEVAVIGLADEKWGEIPLACVVQRAGAELTAHKVMEHVKGYVDRGVLPREAILLRVQFVDAIDKTSVGKTDKLALKAKYASAKG